MTEPPANAQDGWNVALSVEETAGTCLSGPTGQTDAISARAPVFGRMRYGLIEGALGNASAVGITEQITGILQANASFG